MKSRTGHTKGNRFWMLRSKHGRDILFDSPSLLWEEACKYFDWCEKNPFYETEQIKCIIRPFKNEKGVIEANPNTIQLPKLRPFTLHGLCLFLDCNTKYFNDFEERIKERYDEQSKGFSEVITRIREVIYCQKFSGAVAGFFNSNIIARDLGLIERTDITSLNESIKSEIDLSKLSTDTLKEIYSASKQNDKPNDPT